MGEDEKNLGFTPFADEMIKKASGLHQMVSAMRNVSTLLDYLRSPPKGQSIHTVTVTFMDQSGITRAQIHTYNHANPEVVNHLRDICATILVSDIGNAMKSIERMTQELQIAGVDYPKSAGQPGA